jgi:hypothetical protein
MVVFGEIFWYIATWHENGRWVVTLHGVFTAQGRTIIGLSDFPTPFFEVQTPV